MARRTTCPRCGAAIWRGLAGSVDARLELPALSALGEAVALATGRSTWQLTARGSRVDIDHRDQWRIAAEPAGSVGDGSVHAGHRCGHPWPASGPLTARSGLPAPRTARTRQLPLDPPF